MLEAGPQTVLQAFVALRRPEGINPGVLYASMGFSILSVSKTMVTTFVLGGNKQEKMSISHPERVRMFLLSMSYEFCEVVSRIFSVAVVGYFCGGYLLATVIAGEYILLFFSVLVDCSGGRTCDIWWFLFYPLFLQFTSLGCSDEFTFWKLLFLRLIVLAAYVSVSITLKNDDAELVGNAQIFFWFAVVSNSLWLLLMPAFVNSCHNLGITLEYTSYEPYSFTNNKCHYPLEVYNENDSDRYGGFCCGCIYNKKAAEIADKATDVFDMAAGVG